MRPAARAGAAIGILDRILAGEPAEKALTAWGRASRFAGSGDRAAVRDLVYDALRCRRSHAALGGGLTGRGLILGGMRAAGRDPAEWFDGGEHAPAPVGGSEVGAPAVGAAAHDIPDWLEASLRRALGDDFSAVMAMMRDRAPVVLRANAGRGTRDMAIQALSDEGIQTRPHPLAPYALEVTEGARRIQSSRAYADGLVELQDAASQAVTEALPLRPGDRILDLCAGGGGKTLALGARAQALGTAVDLWAHDAAPRRLRDLEVRAQRAGLPVRLTERPEDVGSFALVLADVPCSGSGSWRRDPEGKWALTPERLRDLQGIQATILDRAADLLAEGGTLAYATCSFLREEDEDQVDGFLARHPGWRLLGMQRYSPLDGGDGFFLARLTRA